MKQLIECVPNISEGRDMNIINQVTAEIEKVEGVKLLDVDPGATTNRTVITFVGEPEKVCEAAFRVVKKAAELIDMRNHHGAHPRQGATDVCPLIPVSNISMEEVVEYARALGKRFGEELGIPVYCYEEAAFQPKRKNLAYCRTGEYESLSSRLGTEEWKPDFGPNEWNEHTSMTGATQVGARDFLIAINYNLNTTSTRRANAIAFDVREKGRPMRVGPKVTDKPMKDENGNTIMIPGTLKATKAIGWFIEDYGIAQVSMNITNINVSPVHVCFDEVCAKAAARGVRVTGCEIVGLVPKKVLIDAGKYYLAKQQRSLGISEDEIIKIAIKSMGLDDLKPFNPKEKVIEYLIEDDSKKKLVDMTCTGFANETASESPAPGGGSISAYMGALGASLATMVANLSSHKPGWDDRWEEFSQVAEKGQKLKDELLDLVDEDTNAFNKIMEALQMPKKTDAEKAARMEALELASQYATQVPFKTMNVAFKAFEVVEAMVKNGNPASVSDAGVGALCCRSAVMGAYLNVKINAAGLKDRAFADNIVAEGAKIEAEAIAKEAEILVEVNKIINKE
ncbi:MAG: glutamate formimidoyltransferase [Candidatus Limimorpha sp.]|mgnify:FL=1|nr:glutamate formimidoyltransferase [Bacteroidales bacterium]MCI7377873.1 glutamate formimidoyltransferase [Bacteroidales bacterium]MDD5979123.1 glutamate formimidoyltransferase [Bacteroidales bacterium]MDD7276709.1 glutamate formimidoyltransferase [Bacteroidales bacterium]MDY6075573.1 glutamate formimidoyltransferase [Bacteroidales bacterium]